MAIIEIRDILNNETGQPIFPRTHVDAVIGLKDTSFFETVQDTQDPTKYSVKLKDEYTGLWADGWIAAGGIGTGSGGGGGGLIQTVYTWDDIQEMSSSPEDDTTSAFNAKTVYEIYKMLQAGGLDGGGYLKESGGGFFLTSSSEKILLKGAGHSLSGLDDVSIYNPSVNDLLTWSGYSWINIPQSAVRPDLSGYVTTDTFGAAILDLQTQIDALENFFEIDSSGNVTLKSAYQNLWVSGWLAAGGIGTGGGGGSQTLSDLLDVSLSNLSTNDVLSFNGTDWVNRHLESYVLPAASSGALGGIRIGYTQNAKNYPVRLDGNNMAYVNVPWEGGGSGGGVTSLYELDEVLYSTSPSTNNVFYFNGTLWTATALRTVNGSSIIGSTDLSVGTVTSVSINAGTGISVSSTSAITTSGTRTISLNQTYQSYATHGEAAYNWGNHATAGYVTLSGDPQTITGAKTFTTNPVTIGTGSGLSVATYIDIGDARLEYDDGAFAIRITKKTGVSRTIGLYADGFVAAGGTAASASRNIVYTDGDQTISGEKTFTSRVVFNGTNLGDSDYGIDATCDSKFTNISATGNISAATFGGGIVIEKDAQTYRHISVSDDRLYIQKSVSQDLVLCNGNSSHCVVGTYASPGTNKLYVNGTALATAWNTTSDSRLKDDITTLSKDDAIQKLMRLKPSIWKWNSGLAKGHTASGFIAQEVEAVLPFMVTGEDYKGLSYQMLHAFEVSAIQSHEERISALEKKLND